ncbi:MAG: hypothetical protein K0S74_592 [Chlamydiales bacterium]|jgi:ribosome-associated protein|nr:hypothetical protein [Chlamydiales bacterium]
MTITEPKLKQDHLAAVKIDRLQMVKNLAQVIFDKKGRNIIAFDTMYTTSLFDYCIIAEGFVDKHVQAISTEIKHYMQDHGEYPFYIEGQNTGLWIALDYSDIVIHLFEPEMREKYQLERVWAGAPIIDLGIDTEVIQSNDNDSRLYPVPQHSL